MDIKEIGYIAYRTVESDKDDYYNIGKFFSNVYEAVDFFGLSRRTITTVAKDRNAIRGKMSETWMIFHEDTKIIDVESQLERRL